MIPNHIKKYKILPKRLIETDMSFIQSHFPTFIFTSSRRNTCEIGYSKNEKDIN